MTIEIQPMSDGIQPPEPGLPPAPRRHRKNPAALKAFLLLVVFISGFGSGYLLGGQPLKTSTTAGAPSNNPSDGMIHQINPPDGYTIPATFGTIGPQMLAAGAIDLVQFTRLYEQSGRPLTEKQLIILTKGSDEKIVFNQGNASFLLNFFWAFGLTNRNPVLTEGPMMKEGKEQVGSFASTGGWTIGARLPTELYASTAIVSLTDEQQARMLEVASAVYRPCCNNPTHLPDCNHGMAMLGLLELMASQNATVDEMFTAAKYVNAFWYPQQMLEVATLFKVIENVDFAEAEARQVVNSKFSSGTGFQSVHNWLATNNLLEKAPSSGGGCGVQ